MSNFPINVRNISFKFDCGSLSNRVIVFIRYMFNSFLSFKKKEKKIYIELLHAHVKACKS